MGPKTLPIVEAAACGSQRGAGRWLAIAGICVITALHAGAARAQAPADLAYNDGDPIVIAVPPDNPPYHFRDGASDLRGIAIELWKLWAKRTGTPIGFINADREESIEMVRDGRADAHVGMLSSPQQALTLDFSQPISSVDTVVFHHRVIDSIDSPDDLTAYRVGMAEGDARIDWMAEHYPDVTLTIVKGREALIDAALDGRIRVFIDDPVVALYRMRRRGVHGEFSVDLSKPILQAAIHVAVRKGRSDLLAWFNKGLAEITNAERASLFRRWQRSGEDAAGRMRIIVPRGNPPYMFGDLQGRPAGLVVDLWKLWSRKTGRPISLELANTWRASLQSLHSGEGLVLASMLATPEHARQLTQSVPIYAIQAAFFHRLADARRPDPNASAGLDIGVVEGGAFHEHALDAYALNNIVVLKSRGAAMRQLAAGNVDLVLDAALAGTTHLVQAGLRGEIDYRLHPSFDGVLAAGVRNEDEALLVDINTGFEQLLPADIEAVERRWITDPALQRFAGAASQVKMSARARRWLERHPVIRVGIFGAAPPFAMRNDDGGLMGISVDYLTRLSGLLGVRFESVPFDSADALYSAAQRREIDVVAGATHSVERMRHLTFGPSYMDEPTTVFGLSGAARVASIDDLAGQRVAVVRDSFNAQLLADGQGQGFASEILPVDSIAGGMAALRAARADVLVAGALAVYYEYSRFGHSEIREIGSLPTLEPMHFAVRSDWPLLRELTDRALTAITPAQRAAIVNKWRAATVDVRIEKEIDRGAMLRVVAASALLLSLAGAWLVYMRRQHRRLLRAEQRARASENAKSAFLASMSHEIRTPMNGVLGMMELLSHGDLDGDQQQMLRTARNSSTALLGIIDDVLDFSKIEANKIEIEPLPVDVEDVIDDVLDTLYTRAEGGNVKLSAKISPQLPSELIVDPTRLRQVLFNLVGNAIKFSDDRAVQVVVDWLTDGDLANNSESAYDGKLRIAVVDSGIGMSAEHVERLFQPFSQADASTTRRFGGTGLGLSIVHQLCELMDGTVTVDSAAGVGSTFTVTLPVGVTDGRVFTERLCERRGALNLLVVAPPDAARIDLLEALKFWGNVVEVEPELQHLPQRVRAAKANGAPPAAVILAGFGATALADYIARRCAASDGSDMARQPVIVLLPPDAGKPPEPCENSLFLRAPPIRRRQLITAVAASAGLVSPELDMRSGDSSAPGRARRSAVAAPSVDEAAANGQLVLLVDDNPVNRQLMSRQLAMLGYACETRDDGAQALEAWNDGRYALLLSDCHMPVMNGFELAAAVRAAELDSGSATRRPIIAVTASAMTSEVARCLEAGMDACLTKPLQLDDLEGAMHQWLPGPRPVPSSRPAKSAAAATTDSDSAVDLGAITDTFGDDDAIVSELLDAYLESEHECIAVIRAAAQSGDTTAAGDAAHKLKSGALTIGANDVAELCVRIERHGRADNLEAVRHAVAELEAAATAVDEFIEQRTIATLATASGYAAAS